MPHISMRRDLFQHLSIACLSVTVLIGGCISPDFEFTSLSVQARGLEANESITVSNGSSVVITGRADLASTEPQRFGREYREDNTAYSVSITQQPTFDLGGNEIVSNKTCRILNPNGDAFLETTLVRIECGFVLTVADTIDPITDEGTMTEDNGLFVSNGLEVLSLNSSRSLTTGLKHTPRQDPASTNPDGTALQIETIDVNSSLAFTNLFIPGDDIRLSISSTEQGCQIEGAEADDFSDDSFLDTTYPSADTFVQITQAIPSDMDWIASSDSFSENRTCDQFKSGTTYFLDYSPEENTESASFYDSNCFPVDPINISCGFALQITLAGINAEEGDVMELIATRSDGANTFTHRIELINNTTSQTFNLAFATGDTYTISTSLTATTAKTCEFDSSSTGASSGTFATDNIVETLVCTTP